MAKIILTIANADKLPDRPYPITGINGQAIQLNGQGMYAHLNYDTGRHEIRVAMEDWLKVQPEVAKGFHRSYGRWLIAGAEVEFDDHEKLLVDELDRAKAEIAELKLQLSKISVPPCAVPGDPARGPMLPIEPKAEQNPPSDEPPKKRTRDDLKLNFRTLRAMAIREGRTVPPEMTDIEDLKNLLLADAPAPEPATAADA